MRQYRLFLANVLKAPDERSCFCLYINSYFVQQIDYHNVVDECAFSAFLFPSFGDVFLSAQ